MIPSVAPLVFDGLVDQLRLTAGLTEIQITSGPLAKNTARESIQLFGTQPADEEWAALGNLAKDEIFEIVGGVYVQKAIPSQGAADGYETLIRAVRGRAYELLGYVATFLRNDHKMQLSTGGLAEGVIALRSADMVQGVNTEGRWCEIDLRIAVRARLRAE